MRPIYRWDARTVRVNHEGHEVEESTKLSILASTAEEMIQKARDAVGGREVEHWTGEKYQTHRVYWTTAVEVEQPPEPTPYEAPLERRKECPQCVRRSPSWYRRTNHGEP